MKREERLTAALKEILRIGDAAKTDGESVPPSEAYTGELGKRWRAVAKKARGLVES